jgi:hypothetical protein
MWATAILILFPQEILKDLDSPDPAVARRAIEAAIRGADEKALEAAAKTSRGARFVLSEVRAHKRFGDAYPQPLLFSLSVKDHPAVDVIHRFESVLKKKMDIGGGLESLDGVKVNLELRDATLMEAANALGKALNRDCHPLKGTLYLSTWPPSPIGPHVFGRHVRIIIGSLGEYRDVLAGPDAGVTAMVWGGADPDGQIRIIGTRGLRLDEVVDDLGRAIPPDNSSLDACFGDNSKYTGHQVIGKLRSAPAMTARSITLRGAWVYLLPEGPRIEELPLGDMSRSVEGDNISIRIEGVTDCGAGVRVTARIGDRRKPHVWPNLEDFRLLGKDGVLIAAKGEVSGPAECAVADLTFALPERFEAVALKVRVFRTVGEHQTVFEFKDLPIR